MRTLLSLSAAAAEPAAAYRHKVRFYPLKDASGALVPNAYVLAVEESVNTAGRGGAFPRLTVLAREFYYQRRQVTACGAPPRRAASDNLCPAGTDTAPWRFACVC